MKAFLIDPVAEKITEVEYDGTLDTIYTHLQARCFDIATFNRNRDGVYVDDEGLMIRGNLVFEIAGYPQPLAGRGLVMGCNHCGETVEPTVSLEWLRNNVSFPRKVVV